jgi:hypothetical protein
MNTFSQREHEDLNCKTSRQRPLVRCKRIREDNSKKTGREVKYDVVY